MAHRPVGARRRAARHERRWTPAAVPDGVITDLKARETGGLIDLPKAPEIPPRRSPASHRTARSPGTSVCTPG